MLHHSGGELDLALAAGILAASGMVPVGSLTGRVFIGEAGLDSRVRPVRGLEALLPAVQEAGLARAVVPAAEPLALAPAGLALEPVPDLAALVALLRRH
jgi:magnesium chelatase family protein